MPIFKHPKGLVIENSVYGELATMYRLPPLSRELFFWMTSILQIEASTHLPEGTRANLLEDFYKKDFSAPTIRSHFAACRCFNPPLANEDRTFTLYGQEIAESCYNVFRAAKRELLEDGYKKPEVPEKYQDLDAMFIRAEIPWRAIKLLITMNVAIAQASRQYLLEIGQDSQEAQLPPPPLDHKQYLANISGGVELEQLAKITKNITNLDKVDLDIPLQKQAIDYTVETMKTQSVITTSNLLVTYVPLASLGTGNGRTDWRTLCRYGLLDTRSIRTGNRGRAKLSVLPSVHGLRFIQALVDADLRPPN